MNSNMDKPIGYIRKNREDEAIIYLKDNEQKAAQKLLCYIYATEHNINVLGETTNIEDVKECDMVLVASPAMLTRDAKEYYKIEKELKKKGIKIQVATNGDNIGRYLEMMVRLSRKGRI